MEVDKGSLCGALGILDVDVATSLEERGGRRSAARRDHDARKGIGE
jgi:hypothetical protein